MSFDLGYMDPKGVVMPPGGENNPYQYYSQPEGAYRPRPPKSESDCVYMMTSSNVNISRVAAHLYGEFTGHRWIPRTKASDADWCFLWSAPE